MSRAIHPTIGETARYDSISMANTATNVRPGDDRNNVLSPAGASTSSGAIGMPPMVDRNPAPAPRIPAFAAPDPRSR
ncbi:hypothetical protein Apa02nite_012900 [Actinoplanes palleronii]|uniref:Uncharacterized protein n=1 Tax=Actinoplanes palleronii TaxID=113570 RepID=A0ABQ4B3D5_9ACTN|nr:hypothetical protein Apa02nite_012900 [Actinoplanes palleronii]